MHKKYYHICWCKMDLYQFLDCRLYSTAALFFIGLSTSSITSVDVERISQSGCQAYAHFRRVATAHTSTAKAKLQNAVHDIYSTSSKFQDQRTDLCQHAPVGTSVSRVDKCPFNKRTTGTKKALIHHRPSRRYKSQTISQTKAPQGNR